MTPPAKPRRKARYAKDDARAVDALERQRKVLELRIKGFGHREIAKELGIAVGTSHKDTELGLKALQPLEEAEVLLGIELARLDRYQKALDDGAESGDARSVLAALKIMDRRAKYLGLDAPAQLEHSGTLKHINVDPSKLSDTELRDLASGAWPQAPGGDGGSGGAGAAA